MRRFRGLSSEDLLLYQAIKQAGNKGEAVLRLLLLFQAIEHAGNKGEVVFCCDFFFLFP